MKAADREPELKESSARLARYRANLQAELDRATVYGAMADVEADGHLAQSFRRLAESESAHADFWRRCLADAGVGGPSQASRRARILARLARRFGSRLVLPAAVSLEQAEQDVYEHQPETAGTDVASSERDHARVLQQARDASSPGRAARTLDHLFGRRHGVTGNALRAAVLGANDGLVSNLSLVMGAAGASFSSNTILITGIAGLLAGAFSMAMGEWVSVQSSREMNQRMLDDEAIEIASDPEHERAELVTLYERRGLTQAEAGTVADRILADSDAALDTMARDELGIDPEQLGGSPWTAAIASFLLFTVGALPPILPFALADGDLAVALSIVVSSAALLGIGAAITLLTGRGIWRSAFRQLAIGLGAAAVTYGAGFVVGSVV